LPWLFLLVYRCSGWEYGKGQHRLSFFLIRFSLLSTERRNETKQHFCLTKVVIMSYTHQLLA